MLFFNGCHVYVYTSGYLPYWSILVFHSYEIEEMCLSRDFYQNPFSRFLPPKRLLCLSRATLQNHQHFSNGKWVLWVPSTNMYCILIYIYIICMYIYIYVHITYVYLHIIIYRQDICVIRKHTERSIIQPSQKLKNKNKTEVLPNFSRCFRLPGNLICIFCELPDVMHFSMILPTWEDTPDFPNLQKETNFSRNCLWRVRGIFQGYVGEIFELRHQKIR